jgi:hypothetical protein
MTNAQMRNLLTIPFQPIGLVIIFPWQSFFWYQRAWAYHLLEDTPTQYSIVQDEQAFMNFVPANRAQS